MAAVLSPDQEIVYAPFADITKWEDGPDGSLYVYGKATTPEVDTDEQIIKESFSAAALQDWMEKAPTIRVQHNGQRDPAGAGHQAGDQPGWRWSPLGQGSRRRTGRPAAGPQRPSPSVQCRHCRTCDRARHDRQGQGRHYHGGRIVEVSLVDSPANRSCFLEMAKADKNGNPEWTGALTVPEDVLAKVAEPAKSKTVTVDLPKNVSVSFSPKDLAKLVAHKQVAEERAAAKVAEPAVAKAADVADLDAIDASADPAFLAVKAAEATVYKRDIDTATRRPAGWRGPGAVQPVVPGGDPRGRRQRGHAAAVGPRGRRCCPADGDPHRPQGGLEGHPRAAQGRQEE